MHKSNSHVTKLPQNRHPQLAALQNLQRHHQYPGLVGKGLPSVLLIYLVRAERAELRPLPPEIGSHLPPGEPHRRGFFRERHRQGERAPKLAPKRWKSQKWRKYAVLFSSGKPW